MVRIEEMIEKDFEFLKKFLLGIILFGSYATGEETKISDIDVCLVVGEKENIKKVWDEILKSSLTQKYDIKIFERLPLKIKGEILDFGKIVWCREKGELTYYLFKWRKIWEDQKLALKKLGLKIFH